MNTYRAVQLHTGRWAVQRLAAGIADGVEPGTYATEAEANLSVHDLSYAEFRRAFPPPTIGAKS
jgi:hypothetical protein